MKSAWYTLLVSALSDFWNNAGTALIAMMMDGGTIHLPTYPALLVVLIGASLSANRTIQQALKSTAATTAELRGQPVIVTTITPEAVIKTAPKDATPPEPRREP